MPSNRRVMVGGGVANVLVETELGMGRRHRAGHQPISCDLRHHGSGRNRGAATVTPDHADVLGCRLAEVKPVDEAPLSAVLDSAKRLDHQPQIGSMKAIGVDPSC